MTSKSLLGLAGSLALLASCTASDETPSVDVDPGSLRPRIVNGVASTDDQDTVVMFIRMNPDGKSGNLCTATMIAPTLALTARHCVAPINGDDTFACKSDGTSLSGGSIGADYDATTMYLFTGKARPAHTHFAGATDLVDVTQFKPAAKGVKTFSDQSPTLCNHDLAILQVDTPVNVKVSEIRLDHDPVKGETTYLVGWGISTQELEPSARQQRRDVAIRRLGPDDGFPVLTPNEFLLGESICEGDSGGPVFSQTTNAVLGVISRGTNGQDADDNNPGVTCPDADNIMTKLSPFQDVFNAAFAAAGTKPILEPRPDPGGCSVAAGAGGRTDRGLIGVIFGLLAVIRRRRK